MQTEHINYKGDDFINIREEIKTHKARIKKLNNQITNCYNPELKERLQYELKQEQLKLESYELLLALVRRAGKNYE